MRLRVGIALVLVCVLSIACGTIRRRDEASGPAETVSVGQGLLRSVQAEPTTSVVRDAVVGTLVLEVSDDNGLHPEGIPVDVTGPERARVTSGSDGTARFSGPPGFYRVSIPEGCHGEVLVHEGGSGRLGLVGGRTTEGSLQVIWQHRVGPSGPVATDAGSDWPIGRKVVLTFPVKDHCDGGPARGAAFPSYGFEPSANLRLVGTPRLLAGRDGNASVTVACTSAGPVSLFVEDADNPSERLDLVALSIGYAGVPRCVDPTA